MTANDRDQLLELFAQYGHACDTKDWALLESCFVPDCLVTYEGFGQPLRGYSALQEYLVHALTPLDGTQHLFANFVVRCDGEASSFRCSLQAQHVQHAAEGDALYTVGGTYEVQARRLADGWRITDLRFAPIWSAGNHAVLAHIEEPDAAHLG